MKKQGLTVLIPCLNEAKTIEICIKKAFASIKKLGIDGEVLIADNGSTDGSIELAQRAGARVISIKQKGYGSALRGGIQNSLFEYIIMGDADDSYDFSSIEEFINKLDDGYELVMGNRFKGGIERDAMPFSHRYIGNPFLSGLGRLFFKTKIGDFHCGLRAFRSSSIERLGLCTTGMEFASEMVVKSVLFGLKIAEVPCKLYPDGRERKSHLRSIPDGLRHLEFLLIYSPKWLFVYPGMLFTILGLVLTVAIFVQPLKIGRVQFEAITMLYSALMMLVGIQFLQFSVFTTLFAQRIGQIPATSNIVNKIENFFKYKGFIFATVICVLGMAGIISTLAFWGGVDFGELKSSMVCRTAILFGSLFAMGIETLLFTLFIRILRIGRIENES